MTLKRLIDLIGAVLGLFVVAPFIVLAAIAIKANSTGPIFFLQERIGRKGVPFKIIKLRTMNTSARSSGIPITTSHDKRVTTVGRFLRQYKLDELPQFWNVVVGDMSLVGPRPEVPEFVELYPERQKLVILSVRPGITDHASLRFRNESQLLDEADQPVDTYIQEILPKKLQMNEEYVRTRTMKVDLKIILETLISIVRGAT